MGLKGCSFYLQYCLHHPERSDQSGSEDCKKLQVFCLLD